MPQLSGSLKFGLAAYSFPWRCGFVGAGTPRACPLPFHVYDLLALAAQHGLGTVEFPLMMLPDLTPETLRAVRSRADSLGLALVCDSGVIDEALLTQQIPAAAALGARVLRVMLSSILEGARATIPEGWDALLAGKIAALQRLRPLAEQYHVILAPENHQDATSADLLRICEEVGGEHIGVTLDAVNPLAVGEEPLAFARALGNRIVNVHLKDYRIYAGDSGYRLVRCALGEGILDVRGLIALLRQHAPGATCQIELAALYARYIRLLEDDWWQGYPARDARDLIPALRAMAHHTRPADEDWRTPWERGLDAAALAEYEDTQFDTSVRYLRSVRQGDTSKRES